MVKKEENSGYLHQAIKDYWQLGLLIVIVIGGFYQLKLDIVQIQTKLETTNSLVMRIDNVEKRINDHDIKIVGIERDVGLCIDKLNME